MSRFFDGSEDAMTAYNLAAVARVERALAKPYLWRVFRKSSSDIYRGDGLWFEVGTLSTAAADVPPTEAELLAAFDVHHRSEFLCVPASAGVTVSAVKRHPHPAGVHYDPHLDYPERFKDGPI